MIHITGTIQHVIFRKDDFMIAKLISGDDMHTIKGSVLGVEPKEELTVFGQWTDDSKYGKQFVVERWERPIPKTADQVLSFLSSPLIKGCGPKKAKLIVDALGADALEIIVEQGEASLVNIKGIGLKNGKRIVDSVKNTFEVQRIMIELQDYGLTANLVMKAYNKFGSNTATVLKNNPFELTRINLIGFLKADEVAKRMGILPNSLFRIESGLLHILKQICFDAGHCYVLEDELLAETLKVLNHNVDSRYQLSLEEVLVGLGTLEDQQRVINENGLIFLPFLYNSEKRLAQRILRFLHEERNPVWEALINTKILDYQKRNGLVLANAQRIAIHTLFQHNLMILTGGPGVGKTATTKVLIHVYRQVYPNSSIKLAAPTGRASRKLAEVTGLDACTIHRLVGIKVGDEPEYNEANPLKADLLIVDEFSMADVQLADILFSAISPTTKVLLVGDPDQLPSVNPGNVLRDLLDTGVPSVKLTEIFRQAQGSQIITNAHRINKGLPLVFDHSKKDFFKIETASPENISQTIRQGVRQLIKTGYSSSDILVLSPMKRGVIGTEELNAAMQTELNPPSPHKKEIVFGKTIFREGDKIIHVKNNPQKDVFNGDMGVISGVDYLFNEDGEKSEELGLYCVINGREIPYSQEDLKELLLGYCITIHKSQGGQAPIVIIPMSTSHYLMLARNLLYTGVTRAEQTVFLVGTEKAINMAIRNDKIVQRNTTLRARIKANFHQKRQEQKVIYSPW